MERKNEGQGREYPISKGDSPRVSPVALVVDDDMTVRLLARQALEEIGLLVEETADGASGLSAYERLNPDIVLLDIVMPKLDGFHVCKALRNLPGGGATPVIMMTGQDDLESIDQAYDAGATDFVSKPVNWKILQRRIRYILRSDLAADELQKSQARNRALLLATPDSIFRINRDGDLLEVRACHEPNFKVLASCGPMRKIHELFPREVRGRIRDIIQCTFKTGVEQSLEFAFRRDNSMYYYEIKSTVDRMERDEGTLVLREITKRKNNEMQLQSLSRQLQDSLAGITRVMLSMLEYRDPYTVEHQRRVTDLACAIASQMGLSRHEIDGLRIAAMLHDLGKICIPAEILSKPSRLTESEMKLVKTHPQVSHDILKEIEFPWPVAQIVLQHHERIDGSGYPLGVRGKQILKEAKILAVADVVEAMAGHRPYRPALGVGEALKEVARFRNKLYDGNVVDACVAIFSRNTFKFKPCTFFETKQGEGEATKKLNLSNTMLLYPEFERFESLRLQ